MLHQHLVQRATLPPFGQSCCSKEHNSSLPHKLQAHGEPKATGRGAPRPVVGSRPLPKHRGQLPLGSARLVLAALASTTSCPSHQHLTRSQNSPACAMHGTGSSGRGRLSERPPSRISGCRAAQRSGSAGSGDWLSGHDPHRAPPRKRKFPSFCNHHGCGQGPRRTAAGVLHCIQRTHGSLITGFFA